MRSMRRAFLAFGWLTGLVACDARDSSPAPTPREAMARDFVRAMKSLDLEYENIHDDLAAKKPPEEAQRRLASLRTAAEKAAALPYRESEAENRDLSFEFSKFLDATRKLEKAAWSGEEGERAWRRLGAACNSCHDLYRKDPDR
jgi:cytochrome c556